MKKISKRGGEGFVSLLDSIELYGMRSCPLSSFFGFFFFYLNLGIIYHYYRKQFSSSSAASYSTVHQ